MLHLTSVEDTTSSTAATNCSNSGASPANRGLQVNADGKCRLSADEACNGHATAMQSRRASNAFAPAVRHL